MNPAESFEAIIDQHYAPLFRFAMSLTRAESDAQDLTQHTFYVWATKGHQLRDRSKVRAWLFTTLHRAFLETKRRQGRFVMEELGDVVDELPVLAPVVVDRADSSQALRALAGLDANYQAAVALFYLENWTYKQIAQILEIPLGTVKSRIARGLAQLRLILADNNQVRPELASMRDSVAGAGKETTRDPDRQPNGSAPSSESNSRTAPTSRWDLSSTLLRELSACP
jgi:RNA polymerase sigma-70 factor (ECF subfamily)